MNTETNQNGTRIVFDARYKLSLKPAYEIVELRINSPAYRVGLKNGDVVLSINGKPAHHYTLQEIMYMFYDVDGKRIRLKVDRDDVILNYTFQLEDFFK